MGVLAAESNIASAKYKPERSSKVNNEEMVVIQQKLYEKRVKQFGEGNPYTIRTGVVLAIALENAYHSIEAERLMTKLATMSKRVHGPDHNITKQAGSGIEWCKVRYVKINGQDQKQRFQALQYEENGEKCVVQGPIAEPRNIREEQTLTVASDDIRFTFGAPVICHGLKTLTHLNGKIGDLRSWDEASECFKVHFEDKELVPCLVKEKFLRILFELPDE